MPNPPLHGLVPPANPFAVSRVRPGAIPYLFDSPADLPELFLRFQQNGYRGQIVGPHGCGKSTFLATFLAYCRQQGLPAKTLTLREGERRIPRGFAPPVGGLLAIDGFSQLTRLSRWKLKRKGRKLLVTTHGDTGLPPLLRIEPSLAVALKVARHLAEETGSSPPPETEIAAAFQAAQQSLRETLFLLYDQFEARR